MKYRGMFETFVELDADNEEDASAKMADYISEELHTDNSRIIVWKIESV